MEINSNRLRERDQQAWLTLYDRHVDLIYGLVFRLVGNDRAIADDLFQDIWLSAFQSIEQYDSLRGDIRGWLVGIARRKVSLHWRRRLSQSVRIASLESVLPDELASETMLPLDIMEQLERTDLVSAALLLLSEDQHFVLVQKYIEGRSVADIARQSGKSPKAIESLLGRARATMRQLLGPLDSLEQPSTSKEGIVS